MAFGRTVGIADEPVTLKSADIMPSGFFDRGRCAERAGTHPVILSARFVPGIHVCPVPKGYRTALTRPKPVRRLASNSVVAENPPGLLPRLLS